MCDIIHEWNDGYRGSLACEINEWVGIYETWYWYEMRPYTHGVVMISGMDSTYGTNEVLFFRGWHGIVSMIGILLLLIYDCWVRVNV